MAGNFKMEVTLKGTRYVLNRAACEELLKAVEAFGEDCGDPCKRLREDLRKALSMTESDGQVCEVTEEHTVTFEVRPEQTKAACCAWCGEAGEQLPMSPGDAEPLYVCRSTGCQRMDKPATRSFFTTGYR